MFGLAEEDIQIIHALFARHPEVEEAIIFGSRAKGNQKMGSDIDIALKGKDLENLSSTISGELNDEATLPYIFDIINFDSISNQALIEHIQRVGRSFYIKSA